MSAPAVSPVRALVPAHLSVAQRVRLTAYAMIVASLGLKAWVVLPAWFYSDDFRFIEDAHTHGLSIDFLFTPHDSQLMPVGVAISWLIARRTAIRGSPPHHRPGVAGVSALACLLMLRTLFGDRWGILLPLGLFLVSPMGLEAGIWWSASLDALPMQIAFFLLVTCVRCGRERRRSGSLARAARSRWRPRGRAAWRWRSP